MPDSWQTFLDIGVALAIGLALGLQRERIHAKKGVRAAGGVRTFAVLALLGAVAPLLPGSPWPFVATLAVAGAMLVAAYLRSSPEEIGLTTEALAILTVALGALATSGGRVVAAVVGGVALILASQRQALHGLAGRLSDEDENATIKFVAVALIVLPFLPDRGFGPYGAVNPYDVGRMVLLVAGVSFVGYVSVKLIGPGRGLLVTGILGGLASSTAASVSFARRSREAPQLSAPLSTATVAACTVLFPRVLFLATVASPGLLDLLAVPLGIMAGVSVALGALLALGSKSDQRVGVTLRNPFELAPALWFALLYAVAVLAARVVIEWFGSSALYAVGAASGVADVDAVTLTAARLHATGAAATEILVRVIVLAAIVNGLVKAGIAMALGSAPFARRTAPVLLASSAAGAVWFAFAAW